MILVCCYSGCGIVYGEKEPLSDNNITHGLCPKHFKIYLEEIKVEIGNEEKGEMARTSSFTLCTNIKE